MELFCGNSQCVKSVGCFRRGDPSLIFDGILNVNLSEEKVSSTGVTQGNLELPLLILLINTKHKNNKTKSDTTSSFSLRGTHALVR